MNYSLLLKEFFFHFTSAENLVICLCVGGIVYSFYGQLQLHFGRAGPRCDSGAHPPRRLPPGGHNGAVLSLWPAAH